MKNLKHFYGYCLTAFIFFLLGLRLGEVEYESVHITQPVDNQLIKIDDSTYYRINIRTDTTYFKP